MLGWWIKNHWSLTDWINAYLSFTGSFVDQWMHLYDWSIFFAQTTTHETFMMNKCNTLFFSDYSKTGIALAGITHICQIPTKEFEPSWHNNCYALFIYYYSFYMLLVQPHLLSVAFMHLPWTMFSVFLAVTYIPKISIIIYIKRKLSIFKLMKHDIFTAYHYTGLILIIHFNWTHFGPSHLKRNTAITNTLYNSNSRFSKLILEK